VGEHGAVVAAEVERVAVVDGDAAVGGEPRVEQRRAVRVAAALAFELDDDLGRVEAPSDEQFVTGDDGVAVAVGVAQGAVVQGVSALTECSRRGATRSRNWPARRSSCPYARSSCSSRMRRAGWIKGAARKG